MKNISVEPLASFWTRFRPWACSLEDQITVIHAVQLALGELRLEETPIDPMRQAIFCWRTHEARGEYLLASVWLCVAAMQSRFAATILSARLAAFALEQPERAKILLYRAAKVTRLGSPNVRSIEFEIDRQQDDLNQFSAANSAARSEEENRKSVPKDAPEENTYVTDDVPVLRGKIQYAADKETNQRLKQYQCLELPVRRVIVDPQWTRRLNAPRWLRPAALQIQRRLLALHNRPLRLPPILIVGPPGCGKSRLVADVAVALDAPMLPLSFAGQSDSRALLGTARGWGSANCSIVIDTMMRHRVANPIIFVDEIEKSQVSHHGDPLSALLMLLEPQTAKVFHDPFLQIEADLSHVVWFAGANSLRGLPATILSRFCIVEVDAPDGRDWPVVRSVLAREIEAAYGLPADSLPPIDPQVDEMLATLLDRRRDLRVLRRTFEQVIGTALEENAALPN